MRRAAFNAREDGFTYLAMLLFVALIGIGLTATAEVWSTQRQRDKERELVAVGHEIRDAIGQYYRETPGGASRFPEKLEDLLEDKRYPGIKRHLRRIYRDPMTGSTQWGLVMAPEGGIQGVYSLSRDKPLKRTAFSALDFEMEKATSYSGWRFIYMPQLTNLPR
jgi:type II secretory pathway pseudopilin PulG